MAYALFGLGFVVCTTPQATQAIGSTFSGWEASTLPEEDMATAAEAVRSFSVEGTPAEDMLETIADLVAKDEPAVAAAIEAGSVYGLDAATQELGTSSLLTLTERYSMTVDAISHLRDCTPIFANGRASVGVVGGFGIAGLVALWALAGRGRDGRRQAGLACLVASALVVGVLIALAAWAVLDFNGLFTWMHTLFFADGTWTFSSRSLLIRLFPEAFWAAMAGLWVLVSVAAAAVMALAGKLLRR